MSPVIFFKLIYPKRYWNALAVDLMRPHTLRRAKTAF